MKYLIANWKMNSVDINVWEQEFVNLVSSQNNFPKSDEVKLIVCLNLYDYTVFSEKIKNSKNENLEFDETKTYISSFLFSVKNTPGSLFKVMGGFATNNVNMIKLESYNYGADFVITQFYCEIEGHPEQQNTKFALDDMYHYCSKVRKLGVFEKSPYRLRQ